MERIRVRSHLEASADVVWDHASSMDGVNAELRPVRMSAPPGLRLDASVPLGRPVLRSLVTLGGLIPLDLHELTLIEVRPGAGFVERSRTLLERRWEHRRHVEPHPAGGCTVEDDVTFQPRAARWLVRRIVARVFARRHAFLRRHFGCPNATAKVHVERLAADETPELRR